MPKAVDIDIQAAKALARSRTLMPSWQRGMIMMSAPRIIAKMAVTYPNMFPSRDVIPLQVMAKIADIKCGRE